MIFRLVYNLKSKKGKNMRNNVKIGVVMLLFGLYF